MRQATADLPRKTRELRWAVWDSARLNDFAFRPGDILINTWSKSGTTWMQQIVGQLIFQGDPQILGQEHSPWPEFRLLPKADAFAMAEAQTRRRFLKSHSPLDCIPFREDMQYIFVARDTRDVIWSMYHHHSIITPQAAEILNTSPDLVGPPLRPPGRDIKAYYHHLLDEGYLPGLSPATEYWPHIQGWYDARHLPNVLLVHFNDLKADLEGGARRVADFLGIEVEESLWPQIVDNCSLQHMKDLAGRFEVLDLIFDGGGRNFVNKGTNGRWKEVLSPEEVAKCDEVAEKNLSADCAHWLKTGQML